MIDSVSTVHITVGDEVPVAVSAPESGTADTDSVYFIVDLKN